MILNKTIFIFIASFLLSSVSFGQDRLTTFCPEPINEEFRQLSASQIDSIVKHYGSPNKSGIIKVPIVFHVLTDDPNGVSNISDCIIKNQVEILNNCFRRKVGTQGFNSNPVGADTGIEFFLPCKDGNGNATTGIIRTTTTNCNYTTLNNNSQLSSIKTASSGASNFPNNKFLNIWVVKTMPNNNNVRAQAWWGNTTTGSGRAGVVIHYSYLGSKNSGCPNIGYLDITGYKAYDLGATLVHEIGHYFSLKHTYGTSSNGGCSYTDDCNDTPKVSGLPNALCGSDNDTKGVCVTGEKRMWQNYLDYSDDACMNIFTNDQKAKMLSYISNTANYKTLTSTANVDAVSCPTSTTNFTVSVSSNPTAGGTTSGGGTFASGTSVTVTATPNVGYVFTKWTENGNQVSTNASYTFILSANRNLVANFSQFVVSTSSNPTAGGTTSGGGTFASGTSVTVTATPNVGYAFTKWTENGNQVSTNASYTFILSANRNLVANFSQFVVSTSSNPTAGGTTSGGGTFASGTSVTVTATPNVGYAFTKWTENGILVSTKASYTFPVNQNRSLVANFSISTSSLDEKIDEKIEIFPNPVSSELTIKIADEILNEIRIYNLFGDQLNKINDLVSQEYRLDFSSFKNGIYFVELKLSNGNRLVKKVTKFH
jgi:hypothetical protein